MLLSTIVALVAGASSATLEVKLSWHAFGERNPLKAPVVLNIYGAIGPEGRVPEYRPVFEPASTRTSFADPMADPAVRKALGDLGCNQTPPVYKAPKGAHDAAFTVLRLGPGRQLVAVVAAFKPGGRLDRFWVDWNQDGRFEGSEMAKALPSKEPHEDGDSTVFEYAKPPSTKRGPIHAKIVLLAGGNVCLFPTGYYSGTVDVAGQTVDVGVLDANFDGACGGNPNAPTPDLLLLESGPTKLPSLVQLPDGKFWLADASSDGRKVVLVADPTPTGTVAFEGLALSSLKILSKRGPIVAKALDGKLTLPAGECDLNGMFAMTGAEGKKWNYSLSFGEKFLVEAGASKTLAVGGPLKLSLDAKVEGGLRSFSLNLRDQCDATVTAMYDEQGNRPSVPQLTIIDPEGKVVKTMPFEYG